MSRHPGVGSVGHQTSWQATSLANVCHHHGQCTPHVDRDMLTLPTAHSIRNKTEKRPVRASRSFGQEAHQPFTKGAALKADQFVGDRILIACHSRRRSVLFFHMVAC
jgi:hypothetical protein